MGPEGGGRCFVSWRVELTTLRTSRMTPRTNLTDCVEAGLGGGCVGRVRHVTLGASPKSSRRASVRRSAATTSSWPHRVPSRRCSRSIPFTRGASWTPIGRRYAWLLTISKTEPSWCVSSVRDSLGSARRAGSTSSPSLMGSTDTANPTCTTTCWWELDPPVNAMSWTRGLSTRTPTPRTRCIAPHCDTNSPRALRGVRGARSKGSSVSLTSTKGIGRCGRDTTPSGGRNCRGRGTTRFGRGRATSRALNRWGWSRLPREVAEFSMNTVLRARSRVATASHADTS